MNDSNDNNFNNKKDNESLNTPTQLNKDKKKKTIKTLLEKNL